MLPMQFSSKNQAFAPETSIDEDILQEVGITDLKQYACRPENHDKLMADFFLDVPDYKRKIGEVIDDHKTQGGSISTIFAQIESHITPDVIESTKATFLFDVTGAEAGTWFIDLKNAPGKAGQGKPEFTPDATLKMDSKDFFSMMTGQLKPANAFLGGKLKITGDMSKAMKMEKLLGMLKTKAKL